MKQSGQLNDSDLCMMDVQCRDFCKIKIIGQKKTPFGIVSTFIWVSLLAKVSSLIFECTINITLRLNLKKIIFCLIKDRFRNY